MIRKKALEKLQGWDNINKTHHKKTKSEDVN
jgi:hypothetical protein